MKKLILFSGYLLLAQFSISFAEEPFVFQSVRSMGMGGILSQNPAMLTEVKQKEITSSISYQDYSWHITLAGYPDPSGYDMYLSHIGLLASYRQPNWGISFNHWQRGDRETEHSAIGPGATGEKWKDLSCETCLLLSIARRILSPISIGVNIKYLRSDSDWEKILDRRYFDPDQGISCDIGVLFTPVSQVKIFSIFYNSFGQNIEYWVFDNCGCNIAQELPKNLTLGMIFFPNNKVLLGIHCAHLLEESVKCEYGDNYQFKRTMGLGLEITPIPYFSLRTGLIRTTAPLYHDYEGYYHYVKRNIPTVGLGYRYRQVEVNLAGIFENRGKDLEEFSTVSSVTSTFRYMLSAGWRF